MSDASGFRSTVFDPRGPGARAHAPAPAPAASAVDLSDDVRAPSWEDAASAGLVGPAGAPLAPEGADGNLRRYARWQWRDFWQRRGFWMVGALLFGVWALVNWALADRLRTLPGGQLGAVPVEPEAVMAISHAAFAVAGVLAGLLGVGGLVSRERERGLQRFLFAKPVNIVRYYLQGLAVNSVGSLLVLGGAVLLAVVTAPQALAVGSILAVATAGFVLGGGATFLASTLLRFDAPLAGAYLFAGFPVVAFAENGYRWAMALRWLFPQGVGVQLAKGVMTAGVNPMPDQIVTTAYGLALIAVVWGAAFAAAGAAVLRRRAISA